MSNFYAEPSIFGSVCQNLTYICQKNHTALNPSLHNRGDPGSGPGSKTVPAYPNPLVHGFVMPEQAFCTVPNQFSGSCEALAQNWI